jgi:polyhydroxybutyrate depolymerase
MKLTKLRVFLFFLGALSLLMIHLIPFRTTEKVIPIQNTQRSYYLHLPTGYDSTQKYPLVIMIHGYTDHPLLMELYSGMSKKADKEKFIVVYPKGSNDARDNNLSWNAGFCCGGAKRQNTDDVAFINTMLDELTATYAVDENKVYAAGFSNGAMFAHVLGAQLPSRIKAIAAIGGTIGSDTSLLVQPNRPLPVFIMNAKSDRTIPFSGGGVYAPVQDSVDFWRTNNRTTNENIYKGDGYTKTTYTDNSGKNEVVLYAINEGTHLWVGTRKNLLPILLNQPIRTTDEVWNFFKKH